MWQWWQIQPAKHQSCDHSGHMRGRDQCWGVTNWTVAPLLIERGTYWAVFQTFLRFLLSFKDLHSLFLQWNISVICFRLVVHCKFVSVKQIKSTKIWSIEKNNILILKQSSYLTSLFLHQMKKGSNWFFFSRNIKRNYNLSPFYIYQWRQKYIIIIWFLSFIYIHI